MNPTTLLGATDKAWLEATTTDRCRVIEHIRDHARDDEEAAEFFRMITGHDPGSEKQR